MLGVYTLFVLWKLLAVVVGVAWPRGSMTCGADDLLVSNFFSVDRFDCCRLKLDVDLGYVLIVSIVVLVKLWEPLKVAKKFGFFGILLACLAPTLVVVF